MVTKPFHLFFNWYYHCSGEGRGVTRVTSSDGGKVSVTFNVVTKDVKHMGYDNNKTRYMYWLIISILSGVFLLTCNDKSIIFSSVPMSTSDLPLLPHPTKSSTSGSKPSTGMPKASKTKSPVTQKSSRASPIEEENDHHEAKGSALQEL